MALLILTIDGKEVRTTTSQVMVAVHGGDDEYGYTLVMTNGNIHTVDIWFCNNPEFIEITEESGRSMYLNKKFISTNNL